MKNSTNEERIVSDVRAKKKSLLRRHPLERDQHIGNVFVGAIVRIIQLIRWDQYCRGCLNL